jgi:hypothetical protein
MALKIQKRGSILHIQKLSQGCLKKILKNKGGGTEMRSLATLIKKSNLRDNEEGVLSQKSLHKIYCVNDIGPGV